MAAVLGVGLGACGNADRMASAAAIDGLRLEMESAPDDMTSASTPGRPPTSGHVDPTSPAHSAAPVTAAPGWLPTPGQVAAAAGATRTCRQGRGSGVPRSADQCASWTPTGPVNVIVISRTGDPLVAVGLVWQRAGGNWLVAEANLASPNCRGWTPSQRQFQLRLSPVSRRHLKFVPADCAFPGLHAVVADAHTDLFERKRCQGDHMVDMTLARDAFVAGMSRLPGVHVSYVQVRPTHWYPGGCYVAAVDDGRVAVISLP